MSAAAHRFNPPPGEPDDDDDDTPESPIQQLRRRWPTILARCTRRDRQATDVLSVATIASVTPAPTATHPERVNVTLQTTVYAHIQFLRREPAHLRAIESIIAEALGCPVHVRLEMDEMGTLDEHQRRWQECVIR